MSADARIVDDPYRCTQCAASFAAPQALADHVASSHPADPDDGGDAAGLPPSIHNLVRTCRTHLEDLPPAGEAWHSRQVDLPLEVFKKFTENNLLRRVGEMRVPTHNDRTGDTTRIGLFTVRKPVGAYLESLGEIPRLPCGHRPVRNLGGGRYSCTRDDCDREYDRATVEAAFAAGDAGGGE